MIGARLINLPVCEVRARYPDVWVLVVRKERPVYAARMAIRKLRIERMEDGAGWEGGGNITPSREGMEERETLAEMNGLTGWLTSRAFVPRSFVCRATAAYVVVVPCSV